MELHNFKVGDEVEHKTTDEFSMIIVGFAVHWKNNQKNILARVPNPEYPNCRYYNNHTNKWETEKFHYLELVSVSA